MIMLHKVIDAITGAAPNGYKEWVDFTRSYISASAFMHVFDFGEVDNRYFSDCSDDAALCFSEGLLCLPYDNCVFESNTHFTTGTFKSIYIINSDGHNSWRIGQIQVGEDKDNISPPMFEVILSRNSSGHTTYASEFFEWVTARGGIPPGYSNHENHVRQIAGMVMSLAMLLNTNGVNIERIGAPEKLNRARAKKGRTPIPAYNIVKIKPIQESTIENKGGTHTSPRIHYRRGHIRTLPSGAKTWVKAYIVSRNNGGS